jgi:hypothetical protein
MSRGSRPCAAARARIVSDDIAGDALVRTEHEDAFGMRRGIARLDQVREHVAVEHGEKSRYWMPPPLRRRTVLR